MRENIRSIWKHFSSGMFRTNSGESKKPESNKKQRSKEMKRERAIANRDRNVINVRNPLSTSVFPS